MRRHGQFPVVERSEASMVAMERKNGFVSVQLDTKLSSPAKAGDPVRRDLSVTISASGILGHPPSRVTTLDVCVSRPRGTMSRRRSSVGGVVCLQYLEHGGG